MALKTVRVPADFEGAFAAAEETVARYFADRRFDPEHGTIEISGERYVLLRAASLSVEFFKLVEDLLGPERHGEADEFARNILFDLAHAVGRSDAEAFHRRMGVVEPIERLSAGPIHFAHTGWAFVDIFPESNPVADEDFYLVYDHPYSFESDAWIHRGERRDFPVCIMNAGYSSGWCEASFGVQLVAAEVLCRARGDECCRFVMAHPDRIEGKLARYRESARLGDRAVQTIPDFFGRKRVEDELRRTRDELERRVQERTAELRHANDQLRLEIEERERIEKKLLQTYKLEAIGRLAGGIAHDFNNLMAVVTMNCELLRGRMVDDDPSRSVVEDIADAGVRATDLTRQLLAFGRAGPRTEEILVADQIIAQVGRMLGRLVGDDVEIEMSLAAGPARVRIDRGQLEQIVMNLVLNARDSMPQGGRLSLVTGREDVGEERRTSLGLASSGAHVVVSVQDCGVGMDDEVLGRIFDPFFTTKASGDGTGLGLSTVYGLVRQARGGIAVTSELGVGSTFSIYLPETGEIPPQRRTEPAADLPRGRGETILMVEDQPRLRAVLGRILGDLGYDVVEADSPEDALARLRDGLGIDLLLTDVVMPKISGPELARRVLQLAPAAEILFISGHAPEALREDPLLREREVLLKPFAPEEIARRLRRLLDGPIAR